MLNTIQQQNISQRRNKSVVVHFRINLINNNDGTSTGIWKLTFAALNESGNAIVESIPDKNPEFERAIGGLEYFLEEYKMHHRSNFINIWVNAANQPHVFCVG
jgi:hypothetical protein